MDATYKSDLRELNDFNFARFDAKLDQRIAVLDARLDAAISGLEARVDARMGAFEARMIKWMFLFWVGQAATTVGLVFGVVRLIGH